MMRKHKNEIDLELFYEKKNGRRPLQTSNYKKACGWSEVFCSGI